MAVFGKAQYIKRVEDDRLLTGTGGFTDNLSRPNQAHVVLVRSPHAHARILKIETEAAKGAGNPWWIDLGIVKEGASFEAMMAFNTIATTALTPLRDGPLPRVTGPVYAVMGDAAKGVKAFKDGLKDDDSKDGPSGGTSSLPRTDAEKEDLKN